MAKLNAIPRGQAKPLILETMGTMSERDRLDNKKIVIAIRKRGFEPPSSHTIYQAKSEFKIGEKSNNIPMTIQSNGSLKNDIETLDGLIKRLGEDDVQYLIELLKK